MVMPMPTRRLARLLRWPCLTAAAVFVAVSAAAQESPTAAYKFDEFFYKDLDDARPRVARFVEEVKRHPGAQGYVIGYAARISYDPTYNGGLAAASQVRFLLTPMWGEGGFPFVTLDGGLRDEETVELFVVPVGTHPPVATPTYPADAAVGCTRLKVEAPLHVWDSATTLTFRAKLGALPRGVRPTFRWMASSPGRIVSGQGTPSVIVERPAGDNQSVRAVVVVEGFPDECQMWGEAVSPPLVSVPHKFDEFGRIRCGDELARLDNLAASLASDPRLTAYLVVSDGRDAGPQEARARRPYEVIPRLRAPRRL